MRLPKWRKRPMKEIVEASRKAMVDVFGPEMRAVQKQLDSHDRELLSINMRLERQEKTLEQHSKMLGDHTKKLEDHSKILGRRTSLLERILLKLDVAERVTKIEERVDFLMKKMMVA